MPWGEPPLTSPWMTCLVLGQSPLRHLTLHPHIQTPFRYPLSQALPITGDSISTQLVMGDRYVSLGANHQSSWGSKAKLMGTLRGSPVAQGNSPAASAKAVAVLARSDAVMSLQPSPVRSSSQGPAAHTSEAPPAFKASFPEHHQDSRPAPQPALQPAAQPAPQQPKLGGNNPFGASSFGAKAFPGPSGQTGQAPARVSSSGAGYPVPATPAPSLATGASADTNVFPSQPPIAGVVALPSHFAALSLADICFPTLLVIVHTMMCIAFFCSIHGPHYVPALQSS